MKPRFLFYLRYIIFLLGIQIIFSILFLTVYQNLAQDVGIWDKFLVVVVGLKLDISLTGYLLGIPTLLLIIGSIFRSGIPKKIIGVYTFLIILCLVMAYIVNLVIYKYWKFPIDKSIFDYISTPGDMMASLSPLSLLIFTGLIILCVYALYFQIYRKWVIKPLAINQKRSWLASILFLIILPSLILPVRGGFATSPIQTGSVYFHKNAFINHAAVNPVWNLLYTIIEGDKMNTSNSFYTEEEVQVIMDELYKEGENRAQVLNTDSPNIILILLESFSQAVMTDMGGNGIPAPNLKALAEEGIYFNNFFSTGVLSDRAIGAVFGGYPCVPGTCILHYESKAQKLPRLNQKLKSAGYNSAFFYGGDIDFAHIRSFLVMGGFENIIDDKDFPRSTPRSSWGVPDHLLFEKLLEVSNQAKAPFFHALFTLSSHSPFDVPMEPVFRGSGDLDQYMNSVYYTDQAIGNFISTARTMDWWDETLIIFLADHSYRLSNVAFHEQQRFRIPMVWTGGAVAIKDTVITKIGSQTDLPRTLLNQIGISGTDFRFSKDLLSEDTKSFAYYTYNDGAGFIEDSTCTVYSWTINDYILKDSTGQVNAIDPCLAYLQFLSKDFNDK
jgi:phosphoglycerol transferase MdoB-like AlkP superfamily enzyme